MERQIRTSTDATSTRGWIGWVLSLVILLAAVAVLLAVRTGMLPPATALVSVTLVVGICFWHLRLHVSTLLLVFSCVLFASIVVTHKPPKVLADRLEASEGDRLSREWAASGSFNEELPIVIHLVFDEMMAPGAVTEDLPRSAEVQGAFVEFAHKHSLRIYDAVYSRHFFSTESLMAMMGNEYLGRTALAEQSASFRGNEYFADMADRGYRTFVFQNDLMNFCADANVDMCETFNAFDPGGEGGTGLDPRNQRASLWQTVFRAFEPSYSSRAGQALLARVYGLRTGEVGVHGVEGRYDVQRFPASFNRFIRFASTVPRGSHVFAYFAVPHLPYLLSDQCVISGNFESGYYLGQAPAAEREAKRTRSYEAYLGQLLCVKRKLDEFLTVIEQSPDFKDAVIVIHGDHGSRISVGNMLEDFQQRDYLDNYATFFAIRAPEVAPGVDCEFVSLPEVFRRHMSLQGSTNPMKEPLPVFVVSRAAGQRVEVAMPRFGCGEALEGIADVR